MNFTYIKKIYSVIEFILKIFKIKIKIFIYSKFKINNIKYIQTWKQKKTYVRNFNINFFKI